MSQSPCNAKHTPGPWRPNGGLVETRDGIALGIATACPVKVGYAPKDDAERLANARLIASAPELLEALKGLESWLGAFLDRGEQLGNLDMRSVAAARAAILKAEGRHV